MLMEMLISFHFYIYNFISIIWWKIAIYTDLNEKFRKNKQALRF